MSAKQLLRPCVMLLLAGIVTAALGQPRCNTLPPSERDFARATGACRDVPIFDVSPKGEPAPIFIPVPSVVGLRFDDARARLSNFSVQRSHRASAEPGGNVLEQQPAPPTRLEIGGTVRLVLSDGTLRPAPRVPASDIDGVPRAANPELQPQRSATTDDARTGTMIEQRPVERPTRTPAPSRAPAARAEVERLRVPNVIGMSIENAQARLGRFKVERTDRSEQRADRSSDPASPESTGARHGWQCDRTGRFQRAGDRDFRTAERDWSQLCGCEPRDGRVQNRSRRNRRRCPEWPGARAESCARHFGAAEKRSHFARVRRVACNPSGSDSTSHVHT